MAGETIHDTWVRVTDAFADVARSVPVERWEAPAPPDGWTTRGVVRHLLEWVPAFLASGSSVTIGAGASVAQDPVKAWTGFADQVAAVLADPRVQHEQFSHPRAGEHPLDEAIVLGDVVMHTWDLAKGAGLEVVLDPAVVHSLVEGLRPMGDFLEKGGQYGPVIGVPAEASEQDELIGLIGRDPAWTPEGSGRA